ncbi:MAG: hypothetical protein JSU96_12140, partial [Acidobacteriota bacterium]
MIGPSRGGRVTAVAGHRNQPATFYIGATGGGVWKTTNYGNSWYPISDGFFKTGSIGAIQVAESHPDIVYVGTGSDGLRSNVIIGKGAYKSTDGGETWHHIGLEETGNIGAVLVHPENPDVVYVAAIGNPFAPNPERGVFRSTDGGRSWEKVLFISERTGAVDLEFAPFNPEEIYVALWEVERKPWTIQSGGDEGGIFKSEDGGTSWKHLTSGLPSGLRGKADLAVTPAAPDRVYVLIEAPDSVGGLYRSDDRGATFRQVTDFQPIRNRPFYYTNLVAHPQLPNTIWAMAEGCWRSEDAGKTWDRVSVPHGDSHDLWINPDHPSIQVQSNDGGANVTLDGGRSWSTQNNQPTAELYQVDISDEYPYRLYAGQQDNTTISMPSLPTLDLPGGHTALWEEHGGCETGPAVPKPGDPDIVYANCKGRFGVFNRRTGQEQQFYVGFANIYGHNPADLAYRFQRVAPIHVSPHDPNRVYHGSQFVHVTTDGGETWETISPDLTAFPEGMQVISGEPITIDVTGEEYFSTIYDIQESPHEAGVIWVGSNDGPIHLTRDHGRNWTDVTPPEIEPYGRVQSIEVSPHEPGKAYAAILRYQLGDFRPYGFRTKDYGKTWTLLTPPGSGIPNDFPVRVIREDPKRPGLLYSGTEFGMFISFDDGISWQPFQLNLPGTPITDIKLVGDDLALSTMGRGFWILYDRSPLWEVSAELAKETAHLFQVRDVISRPDVRRGSGGPASPDYPAPGALIDYYLAGVSSEEVRLEIHSEEGRLLRAFSNREDPTPERDVTTLLEPQPWAAQRNPAPPLLLSAAEGHHRFAWDLKAPGPWGGDPNRSSGPRVPPGTYSAHLTIGDWSSQQAFQVRIDPRIQKEGITAEDLSVQYELALQVRDTLSGARRLAVRLVENSRQLSDRSQADLIRIKDLLVTAPIRYSVPRLIDQLEYLYSNLTRASQRPGKDAFQRFE